MYPNTENYNYPNYNNGYIFNDNSEKEYKSSCFEDTSCKDNQQEILTILETYLKNNNTEHIILLVTHYPHICINALLKFYSNNSPTEIYQFMKVCMGNYANLQPFFEQIAKIEDINSQCNFIEFIINIALKNHQSHYIKAIMGSMDINRIEIQETLLEIFSKQQSIQDKGELLSIILDDYCEQFDTTMQSKLIELVNHEMLIDSLISNIGKFPLNYQEKIINKLFSLSLNNKYILNDCIYKLDLNAQTTFWKYLAQNNYFLDNDQIIYSSLLVLILNDVNKLDETCQLKIIDKIIRWQNDPDISDTFNNLIIQVIYNIDKLHTNVQVKFIEFIKNNNYLNQIQLIEHFVFNIAVLDEELQLIIIDKIFTMKSNYDSLLPIIANINSLHKMSTSLFINYLTAKNYLSNIEIVLSISKTISGLSEEYQLELIDAILEQLSLFVDNPLPILNCLVNISSGLSEEAGMRIIVKLINLITSNSDENKQILYNILIKCITMIINYTNFNQVKEYLTTVSNTYPAIWLENFFNAWIKKVPDHGFIEKFIALINNVKVNSTFQIVIIDQLKELTSDFFLNDRNLTKSILVLYLLINNSSDKEGLLDHFTEMYHDYKIRPLPLTLEEEFNQNKEIIVKSFSLAIKDFLPMRLQATDLEVKIVSDDIGEPTLYAFARSLASSKLYLPASFNHDAQHIMRYIRDSHFFLPFKQLLENLLVDIKEVKSATPFILTSEQQEIIYTALWGNSNNIGIVDGINNNKFNNQSKKYNLSAQLLTNSNQNLYFSSADCASTAVILKSDKINIMNILVNGRHTGNKTYPPQFSKDSHKSQQNGFVTQETYVTKFNGEATIDKWNKSNGMLREKYTEGTLKKHSNKRQLDFSIVHEVLYQQKTEALCSLDHIQGIVIDLTMFNSDYLAYCIEYQYEIAQLIEKFVEIDPFFLLKAELFAIHKEQDVGTSRLVLKKLDIHQFVFNPDIIPYNFREILKNYYNLPSYTSEFDYLPGKLNGIRLHTEAVLHNFTYYFKNVFTQFTGVNPQFMEKCLALHDIGKGVDPDTTKQHINSARIIENNINQLGIEEKIAKAIIAIITQDPLGELIKSGNQDILEKSAVTLNKSYLEVIKCFPKLTREQYFKLIEIYYLCDISSYANLKHLIAADIENKTIVLSNSYHIGLMESLGLLFINLHE